MTNADEQRMDKLIELFASKLFAGSLPEQIPANQLAGLIVGILRNRETDALAGFEFPFFGWKDMAWENFKAELTVAISARLEGQSCQHLESPLPN